MTIRRENPQIHRDAGRLLLDIGDDMRVEYNALGKRLDERKGDPMTYIASGSIPRKRNRRRSGITLVELLAVFTVTGTAAAIVIANLAFTKVKFVEVDEFTVKLEFGEGVIGSARVDGEEFNLVSLTGGYTITFDDFVSIGEQAGPAEAVSSWCRPLNPSPPSSRSNSQT